MKMYFDINEVKTLYNIVQNSPLLPEENEPTFHLMIYYDTGLFGGEIEGLDSSEYVFTDLAIEPINMQEIYHEWKLIIDEIYHDCGYIDNGLYRLSFPIASSWLDMTLEHNPKAKVVTLEIKSKYDIRILLE